MKWIIKTLPYLAVAYGGGISGAWLGDQFIAPLPAHIWGWFGAGLTVLAILAGIELAIRGDKIGWGIVALTGIGTGVMDYQYFRIQHDTFTAISLGVLPTGLGILTGIAAARLNVQHDTRREKKETDREKWERERQEKDDEHRRKMEEIRLRAELKTIQPAQPIQSVHAVNERRMNRVDYSSIYDLIRSDPNITIAKMSETTGISNGAIHNELKRAGYHKNGNGWERAK